MEQLLIFQGTGEVSAKVPGKREELRKLDEHHEGYIIGLIINSPTLHLNGIVEKVHEITGVTSSVPTICKLLAKHGITRKKVKQIALQRNIEYRGAFMADVAHYDHNMFMKLVQMLETCSGSMDICNQRTSCRGPSTASERTQNKFCCCHFIIWIN